MGQRARVARISETGARLAVLPALHGGYAAVEPISR